jgi:hypothetical protein
MTDSSKFEAEVSTDQKNINNIHCQYCNSLVLKPELGVFSNNTEVWSKIILFLKFLVETLLYFQVQLTAHPSEEY